MLAYIDATKPPPPHRAGRVLHLQRLCDAFCSRLGVRVAEADSWHWNPHTRTIGVRRRDLDDRGISYCAAILAHEAGHALISRPGQPRGWTGDAMLDHRLHNILEDSRIEEFMRVAYPGTAAWFAELVDDRLAPPGRDVVPLHTLQFLGGCLADFGTRWRRRVVPYAPEVLADLDASRDARRGFESAIPAVRGMGTGDATWARAVERADADALRILVRDIVPRFLACIERDAARLADAALKDDEVADFLSKVPLVPTSVRACLRTVFQALRDRGVPPSPPPDALRARARKVLLHALRGTHPAVRTRQVEVRVRVGGTEVAIQVGLGDALRGLTDRQIAMRLPRDLSAKFLDERRARGLRKPPPPQRTRKIPPPHSGFGEVPDATALLRATAALSEQLRSGLAPLFTPELLRPPRRTVESGMRLAIHRLMQHEADPLHVRDIWLRRGRPDARSAAVLILVDLSGSMRFKVDDAALPATVALRNALVTLGIPTAVYGFQDIPFALVGFDAPADLAAVQALTGMSLEVQQRRPGGNNVIHNDDGPCLREAADHLLARRERERWILVLSDGRPESGGGNNEGDARALHEAIRDLEALPDPPRLLGVGIGPDTDHVADFYTDHVANVPLDALPTHLCDLAARALSRRPG